MIAGVFVYSVCILCALVILCFCGPCLCGTLGLDLYFIDLYLPPLPKLLTMACDKETSSPFQIIKTHASHNNEALL